MKTLGQRVFLVVLTAYLSGICCLPSAFSETALKVAMITWRGETPAETGFVEGLKQYDHPLSFIMYHANQDMTRLNRVVTKLKTDGADLIYVFGTTATKKVLADITTTPVIFNIVTRPVESGIIASWNSSGNNATGVSSLVPIVHQLKALDKVIRFTRLGMIYNPMEQNSIIQRDLVKELETELAFKLYEFPITGREDIPQALEGLDTKVDAVYLPSDSMVKMLAAQILTLVNRYGLPSLSAMEDMVVHDSALLGLVPDYYQLGRLAAAKADLVLKGTAPSSIPTSTLDHFKITVNMNTARQIGINIPTSILVMADRIIR
ncbi:MAG: ABC transporter substrate-binding protein [Pseudomonadota bacterium]